MIAVRIATAVLAGVSLMGLAACGDEKATTTAEPAKPAATSALAEAQPTAEAAPAGLSDKEMCEAANKASQAFKKAFMTVMQTTGGDIPAKDAALMLKEFGASLEKASAGSDSAVGKALQANAAEAAKAAAASDPANAADTPESAKASKDANAACKAAGVKTNL